MKIAFFGTPDFAKTILTELIGAGHDVVCAITRADKPVGRKSVLTPPPVKVCALEHGIPVLQPERLSSDPDFSSAYAGIGHEIAIVASYGRILPPFVLNTPPRGCLNVHGSLLPAYRGAAPIQRAILDGLSETGVTIMQMDEGLDTGDMLAKRAVPIAIDDTSLTLSEKMAKAGASLLLSCLKDLSKLPRVPQDASKATYAAKIGPEDCPLDFSLPAKAVHDRVRALSPSPGAFAFLKGNKVKILSSRPLGDISGRPGEIVKSGASLAVACGEGGIEILSLVPSGKSRMSGADFVRGRNASAGDFFLSSLPG